MQARQFLRRGRTVYQEPIYQATSFTCPNCEAITAHRWNPPITLQGVEVGFTYTECQSGDCRGLTIWVGVASSGVAGSPFAMLREARLVYPPVRRGPAPNQDLSEDIQKDFNEARMVLQYSPRAAAALLRLALQKLMKQLGRPGKNINSDIGALVQDGLRPDVQQAADVLRVTGNDAVHPGQIDTDDPETVMALFELLNIIAEDRITQPARVKALYEAMPAEKLKQIDKRDGRAADGVGI